MTRLVSLREELANLRAEFEASKKDSSQSTSTSTGDANMREPSEGIEHQIAELNRLVQTMLDDAEETVSEHPVATVAGALAIGIVIGRLTAK
jgi:ElaB/YqjD/DUF883 family membrane-anchored ribosome-binding protein